MSLYNASKLLQHLPVLKAIESGRGCDIAPTHVRIEPTEACNFQCRFCWSQDPERLSELRTFSDFDSTGKRRFDQDRLLKLIDELADLGTQAISFVAVGDPLVFPGIEQVIDNAQQRGIKTSVTSNLGMKLQPGLIDVLARCVWVRWSMNGGSKEVYLETNRPRSAQKEAVYDRVQNNVRHILVSARQQHTTMQLNASYVVSRWNKHDVIAAASLAKELGISSISFRPDMGFERQSDALKAITENAGLLQEAKKLEDGCFKVYLEDDRQKEVLIIADADNVKCFYSNHSIYIAANGDVYPCCYTRSDKKYVIGNIANQSFADFWFSEARRKNYKKLDLQSCPCCPYVEINHDLEDIYTCRKSAVDVWLNDATPDFFV